MIRIIGKIPRSVTIACSGGVDSMTITDFLRKGKRDIQLAYFNHDTSHSRKSQNFVEEYAEKHKLNLVIGKVRGFKGRRSMEEFWRDERYKFLENINSPFIITGHHLDDCVETWLMSSFHGQPKLIPYRRNDKIYRPFLMTTKSDLKHYAEKNSVSWVEDITNSHTNFMRNHVRHNIVPQVLKVNRGIRTTIRKKLIELYKEI